MRETGSPLIARDADERAVLLGIASTGYSCSRRTAGLPTVYTDVRQFIDWIVERAI